jgi:hypothetical protein
MQLVKRIIQNFNINQIELIMKTLKVFMLVSILFYCLSCTKEKIENISTNIIGDWKGTGYFAENWIATDCDCYSWQSQFVFNEDSSCYYSEYTWRNDSIAIRDTGSFSILKDTLYIYGIEPYKVYYNSPIRGKLTFKKNEFEFEYRLYCQENQKMATITRFFDKKDGE